MANEGEDQPDDLTIKDHELLLRRVHRVQITGPKSCDRSVFRDDDGGLGTSLTVWRSDADFVAISTGHDDKGIIAIAAGELRKYGLKLVFTYEEGNPHHCEAVGSRGRSAMGKLRDASEWIRDPLV